MYYHICGLFGSDCSLENLIKISKLPVHHYQPIYTGSMSFFPYSTELRQFKIPPIVLFELILYDMYS